MTANNTWPYPARPGVPMNPEQDGWHWLKTPDNEVVPFEWRVEGECERGHWPSYWVRENEDCWLAEECEYIGPCLTPDEATALQASVAELEGLLGFRDSWIAAWEDVLTDTVKAKDAEIVAKDARIAELEGALRFYANDENWRRNGQLDPDSGNFTGGPARAALEGRKDG